MPGQESEFSHVPEPLDETKENELENVYLDKRQKELSEVQTNALAEGRRQQDIENVKRTYPEVVQRAMEDGKVVTVSEKSIVTYVDHSGGADIKGFDQKLPTKELGISMTHGDFVQFARNEIGDIEFIIVNGEVAWVTEKK
jgi:hypothetical protein